MRYLIGMLLNEVTTIIYTYFNGRYSIKQGLINISMLCLLVLGTYFYERFIENEPFN